jgi:hypothetical protein
MKFTRRSLKPRVKKSARRRLKAKQKKLRKKLKAKQKRSRIYVKDKLVIAKEAIQCGVDSTAVKYGMRPRALRVWITQKEDMEYTLKINSKAKNIIKKPAGKTDADLVKKITEIILVSSKQIMAKTLMNDIEEVEVEMEPIIEGMEELTI